MSEKNAARYASQPSIELGGGMGATPGYGNMNRFSSLFGVRPGTNFMQAAMAGQQNPNQAKNLHMPSYDPATTQGIMNAAQKVAEFSYRAGVDGCKSETPPDWLVNALDAGYSFGKRAEVTVGTGNVGAEVAQTGANDHNQAANRPGQVPGQGALGAQGGGMGAQSAMQTGLGIGFGGVQRGNPIAAAVRANWAGLAPGTSAPVRPGFSEKAGQMISPGPAGLPPQGAAVQAGPPGPPGMPQSPMGGPPPGALPGPPGAPGMPPGMPPGAPPGQPMGPPPPTAPMSDPPPMPLPANPRPAPPSPKSSVQAQGEADMLGLMEAKQRADTPTLPGDAQRDLQAQAFAGDAKMAGSPDDLEGMDYGDVQAGGGRPLRIRDWLVTQKAMQEGMGNWLPRHFANRHTPMTELLSSPGKGGVLGGLLGAGLGGVLGGVGGHLAGLSPSAVGGLALGGAGVGGALGGLHSYGKRRERNDAIMDALRHLPPGATVGDLEHLHKSSALKSTFEKDARSVGMDVSQAAPLALLMGASGAYGGSGLGGLLGSGAGYARGNVPEGLGRGIVRGGLSGAGAGVGSVLGGLLANRLGAAPGLGMLAGAGLGGLGGFYGGGKLMGKPAGGRKEKEKQARDDLKPLDISNLGGLAGAGLISGSALGGMAGTGAGIARGNVPEGLGRGIIRGGLTGIGAGAGSLLGAILANRMGVDYGYGQAAGAGLGGLAGFYGGGKLIGDPVGSGKKKKAWDQLENVWHKQAQALQGDINTDEIMQRMPDHVKRSHPRVQRLWFNQQVEGMRSQAREQMYDQYRRQPYQPPAPGQQAQMPPYIQISSPQVQDIWRRNNQPTPTRPAFQPPSTLPMFPSLPGRAQQSIPVQPRMPAPSAPSPALSAPSPAPSPASSNPYDHPTSSPIGLPPRTKMGGLLHDMLVDHMRKFAAQDSSKPQRSATGESEGLTYQHKPDHYVHGQEAWASADQYFHKKPKTPNPFQGRHSGEKRGLDKLAFNWGEALPAVGRAIKGLWRPAVEAGESAASHLGQAGAEAAGHMHPTVQPHLADMRQAMRDFHASTLPGAANYRIPAEEYAARMRGLRQQHLGNIGGGALPESWREASQRRWDATAHLGQAAQPPSRFGSYMGHYDPNLAGKGWGLGKLPSQLPGMGMRGYMGGLTTGMIMNPELSPEEQAQQYRYGMFNPGNWNAAQWAGATASGLMGHKGIAGSRLGQFVQPTLERGFTGGFGGGVVDLLAGVGGLDTHGMGARLGAGLGVASGMGSNRVFSTARQDLAQHLNTLVEKGVMTPEAASGALRQAEGLASRGQGALGEAMANSWGGRIGAGLQQLEHGSMAPVNYVGRQLASVPRRMLGYTAEEMANAQARPGAGWLERMGTGTQNLLGKAEQAGAAAPAGWQRGLRNVGMAGTLLPLGAAGLATGSGLIGNAMTNKAKDVGAQMYNETMPQFQSDIADFIQQQLDQRGLLDARGQFNPLGGLFGQGGPMSGLARGADSILSSMGMDPSRMTGAQKAMLLGGGLFGGGGLATGHPLAAAGGGLSMLGGLLPYLATLTQGSAPYGGQPSTSGGQQLGYGGMQNAPPPNTPVGQNEWQRQQQLNRPTG